MVEETSVKHQYHCLLHSKNPLVSSHRHLDSRGPSCIQCHGTEGICIHGCAYDEWMHTFVIVHVNMLRH